MAILFSLEEKVWGAGVCAAKTIGWLAGGAAGTLKKFQLLLNLQVRGVRVYRLGVIASLFYCI